MVVIDEFQLIAKKDASFMESIEKLRMKRLYPGPVLILLCSSSVAWVEQEMPAALGAKPGSIPSASLTKAKSQKASAGHTSKN